MRNRTPDSMCRWYNDLKDENTQALLDRLEAEMDKEEIENTDLIEAIMMILDERSSVPDLQETPEESLKRFRAQYAPILEGDLDERRPRITSHKAVRVAVAACLCVVMSIAVAQACGINLIANFLEWREETFVLRGGGASGQMVLEDTTEGDYTSMREALAAYNITMPIIPTWIPARFEIQYVKAKEQLYSVSLTAVYKAKDSDEEVVVKVYFNDSSDVHAEHSDSESIPYVSNGTEFVIANNNEQRQAAWVVGKCVCSINGDLTEREIKQMIDSIFAEER